MENVRAMWRVGFALKREEFCMNINNQLRFCWVFGEWMELFLGRTIKRLAANSFLKDCKELRCCKDAHMFCCDEFSLANSAGMIMYRCKNHHIASIIDPMQWAMMHFVRYGRRQHFAVTLFSLFFWVKRLGVRALAGRSTSHPTIAGSPAEWNYWL